MQHAASTGQVNSIQFLKRTSVSSLALGFISQLNAGTRVNNGRLLDNQTITVQASNVASGVRQRNFVGFIGIQPNLAFSALEDGSGEALLELERDCREERIAVR